MFKPVLSTSTRRIKFETVSPRSSAAVITASFRAGETLAMSWGYFVVESVIALQNLPERFAKFAAIRRSAKNKHPTARTSSCEASRNGPQVDQRQLPIGKTTLEKSSHSKKAPLVRGGLLPLGASSEDSQDRRCHHRRDSNSSIRVRIRNMSVSVSLRRIFSNSATCSARA